MSVEQFRVIKIYCLLKLMIYVLENHFENISSDILLLFLCMRISNPSILLKPNIQNYK